MLTIKLRNSFHSIGRTRKVLPSPPPWYKEGVNGMPPSSFLRVVLFRKDFTLK